MTVKKVEVTDATESLATYVLEADAGPVVVTEAGWALLGPAPPMPGLYHSLVLMTALALATPAYGFGLVRLLPPANAWADCARRTGPVLGALACLALLAVLAQEAVHYDPVAKRTPVHPLAVAVVMAALLGMMAASRLTNPIEPTLVYGGPGTCNHGRGFP